MSWRRSGANKKQASRWMLALGDARIELATSTMSTWHSPAELTARCRFAIA